MIRGTVRDAESREIVRNAFVALLDSGASMVSGAGVDQRGRFSLVVPQPGVYAVYTTKAGYVREVSQWIEVASSADTFVVTVRLARTKNTLSPIVIEAQRDSIRSQSVLGMSARTIGGTIVTPAEVAMAAQTASSAYDLVETLHVPSLAMKTINISGGIGERGRGIQNGTYRCIAYRRTNGCVTVIVNGQRFSDVSDLLQLESILAAHDISHMIFLRPNEAGTLFGSVSSNGVLVVVTKGVQ